MVFWIDFSKTKSGDGLSPETAFNNTEDFDAALADRPSPEAIITLNEWGHIEESLGDPS